MRKFPTIAKCHLHGLENLGVQRNNEAVGSWMETVITTAYTDNIVALKLTPALWLRPAIFETFELDAKY